MKKVYVTNIEYDFLFNEGGDGLVAFFATLRSSKPNVVIKKVGKKGSVVTVKEATGLSRTTIQKYLPTLLELGMVSIHHNGNIAIHGRKWSSKHLPGIGKTKLIPIQVHKKFTDTKICSAFVRVHSRLKKQERQIERKAKRIEVLRTHSKGRWLSKSDYRICRKLLRRGITIKELESKYRSYSTISNLSFHKILKDSQIASDCNANSGKHFKLKLIELGLIQQQRISFLKCPNTNDCEYIEHQNSLSGIGGFHQGFKGIYHEYSPKIELTSVCL
ncbi:hypothetical protein M3P19_00840 [Muricauda sp. 2012CJ35-5]|uniref:Uncharacterized protein n=1 Tax=Flagellimonas spongiicola TaxID=2942208 RepID=A0ABT0PNK1_9FLAO|nr:hypothetical protein [Allomuricauda spongiicola]MCL6272531.1 hypothetical protein [Allomuricauda spongiicola]